MKKKLFSVLLATTMVVSLFGCGEKKVEQNSDDTSNKAITAEEYAGTIASNAAVYKNHMSLPQYKGISVAVDKSSLTITDKDVQSYIDTILAKYATTETVKEGVTAVGDTITLDYSGKKDGVAFTGGTATDATYTVGSKKFITDLDEGLVGLTVGKKYDIPCRFPDNYSTADLAGKDVIFEVTVTAINKTITPDLTDEWVAGVADEIGLTEEKTVAGLKKQARAYLEESAKSEFDTEKFYSVLDTILENLNVENYPQKEFDALKEIWMGNIKSDYEENSSLYSSYYNITSYEAYLKSYYDCENEEALGELADDTVKSYLKEKMLITLIADENNISVSADEINELGKEYAEYYSYESYDEMLKEYTNVLNAELGYELLVKKVQELLNENAVETEKTTEASTEAAK